MPYVRKKHSSAQGDSEVPALPIAHRPSPYSAWWVELPLYAALFFAPLAIATVHLASQLTVASLAIFSFMAMVIRYRHQNAPIKLFPMGLALLLISLWTMLSWIPLPRFLVGLLNPEAEEGVEEADQWFFWDVNRPLEGSC